MSKNLINGNGGKKQNADAYNERFYKRFIKGDRLDNQATFRKYVEDDCIHKTNSNSEFVSQGLCHSGEYALTTSYYKKDEVGRFLDGVMSFGTITAYAMDNETNFNSRVDIHDKDGNNKTVYFEHSSHVGGIAYHEESGKFYVSCGGSVNIYDEETFANAKHGEQISSSDSFKIAEEVGQSSYLAVHNDNFYVGKWKQGEINANLAKYEIDPETGKVSDNPTIYKVPFSDVQGMEIYEKDGKEYFIFSSTDNFAKAELHVAVLNGDKFESVGSLEVPAMLEQISINKDGKLGMVFESDAEPYDISSNRIGEIMYMDIDKAIGDMEIEKEKMLKTFHMFYDKDKDGEVDDIDKWNRLFNRPETVGDYIDNAFKWVEEKADNALDFDRNGKSDVKEGAEWVADKVEKGAKAIYNAGKEVVDDIGDGLDKAGDWAKDKWDDFMDLFD